MFRRTIWKSSPSLISFNFSLREPSSGNNTKMSWTWMLPSCTEYIILNQRLCSSDRRMKPLSQGPTHTCARPIASNSQQSIVMFHSVLMEPRLRASSGSQLLSCGTHHVTYYQVVYLSRDTFPIIPFAHTVAAVLLPVASAPPSPQHPPVGSNRGGLQVFAHHSHHSCVIIWGSG